MAEIRPRTLRCVKCLNTYLHQPDLVAGRDDTFCSRACRKAAGRTVHYWLALYASVGRLL